MATYQDALMDQLDPTRKKKADEEDRIGPKIENTGIAGERMPVLDQPLSGPLVDANPKPTGAMPTGAYDYGRVSGAAADKFNDPNKHDYKYDVLRTLSQFDPSKGFTPDALAALNALGYGTFSSSGGDKLSLTGAKNAKDAKDFKDLDYIFASKSTNPGDAKWQMGTDDTGGGAGAVPGANFVSPVLLGQNAGQNIQDALGRLGQPSDLIQQLIARLQGGA